MGGWVGIGLEDMRMEAVTESTSVDKNKPVTPRALGASREAYLDAATEADGRGRARPPGAPCGDDSDGPKACPPWRVRPYLARRQCPDAPSRDVTTGAH